MGNPFEPSVHSTLNGGAAKAPPPVTFNDLTQGSRFLGESKDTPRGLMIDDRTGTASAGTDQVNMWERYKATADMARRNGDPKLFAEATAMLQAMQGK